MDITIIYIRELEVAGKQISLCKTEYTDAEMDEVFSTDERVRLDAGQKICRVHSFGHLEIVSATALAMKLFDRTATWTEQTSDRLAAAASLSIADPGRGN